jgi:hypothetical protein
VKRPFKSAILWRLAAVALIFLCAGIASAPAARGSGPPLAVTQFANDAGAPQSTIDAMSNALYSAVDQSGKFTAAGGGPVKVQAWPGGANLASALSEAQKVGAQEVIIGDLLSASGGTVTYRLSAYRVSSIAFIRDNVFTQSSLAPPALTAGFVTNIATLHAPRIASGTIYSLSPSLIADLGSTAGFNLGEEFNVVRDGQKMAQAKIVSIDLDSATVAISNPVPGYKPLIGDQLIALGPQPAIPPAPKNNASTFNIFALAVATGAALLAIGHHGEPANAGPIPSPTASAIGGFMVTPNGQSGAAPAETFIFRFSQPVNIPTGGIPYTSNTYLSFSQTRAGVTINPAGTPIGVLGGPTPTFDTSNTIFTIGPTSSSLLQTGDLVVFTFTNLWQSTLGVSLTSTTIQFTLSVGHHPAIFVNQKPVPDLGGVLAPVPGPQGGAKPQPPVTAPHGPNDPKDPKNPR